MASARCVLLSSRRRISTRNLLTVGVVCQFLQLQRGGLVLLHEDRRRWSRYDTTANGFYIQHTTSAWCNIPADSLSFSCQAVLARERHARIGMAPCGRTHLLLFARYSSRAGLECENSVCWCDVRHDNTANRSTGFHGLFAVAKF